MFRPWLFILICAFGASISVNAKSIEPLLLQNPTMSASQIAFAYGGEIWIVSRDGGDATRLVTGSDRLISPVFSPDGTLIAYSGNYSGNADVYVVPATGGEPQRLTYHPSDDVAIGWTPDGTRVLFTSRRASYSDPAKFFTMPLHGDPLPAELPLPMGSQGSYSPDGTHFAYVPIFQWEPYWKDYRGGQTTPIWIADLSDSSIVKIPRDNSNDKNPMWVGDTIYFLSDRNGPTTLFAYDLKTGKVTELIHNTGFDIISASAGPGGIVYDQFGSLHIYDFATHSGREVRVRIAADMPQLRPHFERVTADMVHDEKISPTGKRAVFEAHGQILTVPAEKGDFRNLTPVSGVANRNPTWSPDGKSVAWFSDESGEYELHIGDERGMDKVRKIKLDHRPTFYYDLTWSPDSQKIAWSDKPLHLCYLNLTNGEPVRVDTDYYDEGPSPFDVKWSADSCWLTYNRILPNMLHAVFVYSLPAKKATQITDGMSDARYPAFDRNGKYLYFAASTDFGLTAGDSDMSGIARPVTYSVYTVVLQTNVPSPVEPQSDDENVDKNKDSSGDNFEKRFDRQTHQTIGRPFSLSQRERAGVRESFSDADFRPHGQGIGNSELSSDRLGVGNPASKSPAAKPEKKAKKKKKAKKEEEPSKATNGIPIVFENILQRIVSLPIPARNYTGLEAGKEGIVFLGEGPKLVNAPGGDSFNVYRFDLDKRKTDQILTGVDSFDVSADGEKCLYRKDDTFYIADSDKGPDDAGKALKLDGAEVYVDPPAEWRQMYHEVWRIERDFFFNPHFNGLDLTEAERVYQPFLDRVASRDDLNTLFRQMIGNLAVGHLWVRGGTEPKIDEIKVGLLGADYEIDGDRYRFKIIYDGQNWNPDLQAPLTQPGVNVKTGDYLLAVNGRHLYATNNLYSFFQETAGKQTVISVGANPNGSNSCDVTVVPLDSEFALRNYNWIEGNRRKVDEMTGGKVAYVYLPDTSFGGYKNFNRYFFSQTDKQAAIVDERFNHGGWLADYIVDYLNRPILNRVMNREGHDISEPLGIFGPKVMIINQFAGSGGDALPWYFRKLNIGPLVGMKTWGGLVGIGGYPDLIDGGTVMAPRWAIYGLHGDWEVENHGIAPDDEVEMDPKLVREGHDPQLEEAVKQVLKLLKEHPPEKYRRPAYPDYHQTLPAQP
ncbi:MAG TPA: PDZ domain-containing protein [Verrucomicrobiae bacterium]|jgi:tricorn protease|nr:PDZ domain-containing protein [Verrucomicrobiae bacterium]